MKFQKGYINREKIVMKILTAMLIVMIVAVMGTVGTKKLNDYYINQFAERYGMILKVTSTNIPKMESLIFDEKIAQEDKEKILTALPLYSLSKEVMEYYEKQMGKEMTIDMYMFMQVQMSLSGGVAQNYRKFKGMDKIESDLLRTLWKYE